MVHVDARSARVAARQCVAAGRSDDGAVTVRAHGHRRRELSARHAALEMGVEQARVDAELLAVRPRRDVLSPSLARHGHQVAGDLPTVPGSPGDKVLEFADVPASCAGACRRSTSRLAEAAAEGDNVAVTELVRRTESAVWQLCAVLGSEGETEDLVQETYLRALRGLPRFRGEAPVRLWLLSIARRTCADHVRRRQRHRRIVDRMTIEAASGDAAADVGDLSATVDLLSRLDRDRREAFALTQLAGLSYEEAALVVDCPIGTIRSRVARARDDLRAAMSRDFLAS